VKLAAPVSGAYDRAVMDASGAEAGPPRRIATFIPEHAGLVVRDINASVRFFRDALAYSVDEVYSGLTHEIADMVGVPGARCDLTLLRPPEGEQRLELIEYTSGDRSGDPEPSPVCLGAGHVAYVVPSLSAALAHLERFGARPMGSVVEYPDGPAVYCQEPGGAVIELLELRA
jgi:catechol 2,3-dioxygenase-like lactoylglutathione lyase family enzyme